MKNKFIIIGLLSAVFIGSICAYFMFKPDEQKPDIIAVVTTLSHPALERARLGFIKSIKAQMPQVKIVDFNAEGSMQQANMIARQIAQNPQIKGIFALASLAAQTLAKSVKNQPIVTAAVSDPKVILPEGGSVNICGLTDAIDPDFQIAAIIDLLPNIKSLALLYSPHENNSASAVKKLQASAEARNLKVKIIGVFETQQIPSASFSACQNSDAVLIPLDNTLAAAMPAVIKATKNLPCPVIISDEALIKDGAAIAFGVDYEKSGEQAGIILADILNNKTKPAEVGFINPSSPGIYINSQVIKTKNITINPNSKNQVIHTGEQ